MAINKIMVLGAGTMGMGIAQVFAEAGKTVIVRDIADAFIQRGEGVLTKNMEKKVAKGKITEEEKNAILVKEALDRDRLLMLSRQNMEKQLKEEISKLPETVLPAVKLTARELEIGRLTSQGLLSKEVADKLGISQRTVETHKNNLYRKLGINNNAELVSYMHKAGLL